MKSNVEYADATWYLRKRYLVTFLTSCGLFCMVLNKTNLNIAIVEFTSDKNITVGNKTHVELAEFQWTPKQNGVILSLNFYGTLGSFPLGSLALKFGGAKVFGSGIVINAVLSILTPIFLRLNFYVYGTSQILVGLFEGMAYASYLNLFVNWAPPQERIRLLVFTFMGRSIGYTITYAISGYIIEKFGWEAVFYVSGGIALIWSANWFLLVKNNPKDDKFISKAERIYLMEVNQVNPGKIPIPWNNMITSKPFWAYFNECFSMSWVNFFLTNALPMYIKDVTHKNIEDTGFISSIPGLFALIAEFLAANLADYLRSRKKLSISNVHKLYFGSGHATSAVLLFITGIWINFEASIVTFSLIAICMSIKLSSLQALPIDLFSQYGSFAQGLGNLGFGLGSLLASTIMGFMVSNHTHFDWSRYFLLLSILDIWAIIIFFSFGTGKLQSWVIVDKDEEMSDLTSAAVQHRFKHEN